MAVAKEDKGEGKPVVRINDSPAKTTLSRLWASAIDNFIQDNNVNLEQLEKAGDVAEAGTGVAKAAEIFKRARHPKDQADKIVVAVGGCLDWLDKAVGLIADAVPDGYGTPAKIVAGTISYMIKAAKNMTADFDLIEQTFESIHNAVRDIDLLADHPFKDDHFTSRLMEIFLALFDFCGYTTKVFREYSRKRMFVRALMKGRNEKVNQKCSNVQKAVLLFRDTAQIKALDIALDSNERLGDLPKRFDELPYSLVAAIRTAKLKPSDFEFQKKSSSVKVITEDFKKRNVNVEARSNMEKQMTVIEERFVPGTFSWVNEDTSFTAWSKGSSPFIFISGSSGAGKTYFANKCYRFLQELSKTNTITGSNEPDRPRQASCVTCFLFEPGKEDFAFNRHEDAQSFQNVLASLILQIAEQDPRLGDSMAQELKKCPANDEEGIATFLWQSLILKKFERSSESPRTLYVLLDGIDQMTEGTLERMLEPFKALGSDKHSIRVLMTGPAEMRDKIVLKSLSTIDLDEKTRQADDMSKVIDHRIARSNHLKSLGSDLHTKMKDRFKQGKGSIMSSIDLLLTLVEQSEADQTKTLQYMEYLGSPEWLYETMIRIVKEQRSDDDRRSVERIYSWCTFAKVPLSVQQLCYIGNLDGSLGTFDVGKEILQGKSSSLLFSKTTSEDLDGSDSIHVRQVISDRISFRQPAVKEYLERGDNGMIEDSLQEKIGIFMVLCDVLCSGKAEDPSSSSHQVQEYAAFNLIQHLADIDIKRTNPEQGARVVEAIAQVMTNRHNACAAFESVMDRQIYYDLAYFDLYEPFDASDMFSGQPAALLLAWAKKMSFHDEEELTVSAREWVATTIRTPQNMLEALGRGHLDHMARQVTWKDARIPYKMTYRALFTTGLFTDQGRPLGTDATKQHPSNHLWFVRARNAAALLLNDSFSSEDQDKAARLYRTNLKKEKLPRPERFYSLLGLAEYHARKVDESEDTDGIEGMWAKVQKYTTQALNQWEDEKGALGSDLHNERYLAACLLQAKAFRKLRNDSDALKTCESVFDAFKLGQVQYSQVLLDFLTMIAEIHFNKKQYGKILYVVRRQSARVRSEWIYDRPDRLTQKGDQLRQAAVHSRRMDILAQLYEGAVEYWQPLDPIRALDLQYDLSLILRQDTRTTMMSEVLLDGIIDMVKVDINLSKGGIIRSVFPFKTDILFEKYCMSGSDDTRLGIIETLTQIIKEFRETAIIEPIALARAYVTLAKMQNQRYGWSRAMFEADQAFKFCIADLEDTIGSNDAMAFDVLAIVLSFAGIEDDARIALSLRFSEVRVYDDSERPPSFAISHDDNVTEADPGSIEDVDSSDTESDADSQNLDDHNGRSIAETNADRKELRNLLVDQVEQKTAESVLSTQATKTEASPKLAKSQSDNDLRNSGAVAENVHDPAKHMLTEAHHVQDGSSSRDESTTSANGDALTTITTPEPATKDVENRPGILDKDTVPLPSSVPLPASPVSLQLSSRASLHKRLRKPSLESSRESSREPSRTRSEPGSKDVDEDLFESGGIGCVGPCETPRIDNWVTGQKWYMCLDCVDSFFCADCHVAQMRYWQAENDGFWYKCCWDDHCFIEAPIEDWRGVKKGIIRIGDKEKPWPDWLDTVKKKWARKMAEVQVKLVENP
ncbi:hypothetical protein LTS07_010066 [Exophiala sideris]|uniref:Fungal STAND N-terminal Goodbye domain-containing protein n=1 Tax=Exophiala sideris TaxID=1016849 RepID=A0ABR0IXN2_9EURO|nr:hypothetical protein LTS07_010066 [Exophiala sideris]KAK5027236.1 hypothetical protein LTR13_009631 [Exophiala sideris]KAK5051260.1 hypothetical protein LTR69_010286 [Exophiala sideris]KAK5177776.1 hypothetical protein LTR44_009751 [Eurotiomycetes sp. CCFEE 6388]